MFDNGGLNGFIDTLGNVVIPIKYSALGAIEVYEVVPYSIYKEENGKRVQKYGLINDKGEIVLDATYDFIVQYSKVYQASILKESGEWEHYYLDDTGRVFGDGGRFDKFVMISTTPPLMFYAEYRDVAYLLDEDFRAYASEELHGRSFKENLTMLLKKYCDRYDIIDQDLKMFYFKLMEGRMKI